MNYLIFLEKFLPLVVTTVIICSTGVNPLYTNPVLDSTSADPYIYLHDDGFYYFVLSAERGIVVMKNDILTDWRNPIDRQRVFAIPEGYENLWAPEIHYIDGQWYIYFTMGTGPIPTQRMWVIQALNPDNPLGAYTQAKRLTPPAEDYYQIDGTVVQYGSATNLYMMWSGCDIDGIDNPTNMYIAPMRNPLELSGTRTLLRTRTQGWEGTVIEGPQVIWNGTRLFIIFSANHYTTSEYCLGIMGIDDYRDPLVISNWWHNRTGPAFYKNEEEGVYGPGHASFTYSPDRTEGWLAYHAMQATEMPDDHDNRTTRVAKYTWSPEGYPVLPRPLRIGTPLEEPSGQTK